MQDENGCIRVAYCYTVIICIQSPARDGWWDDISGQHCPGILPHKGEAEVTGSGYSLLGVPCYYIIRRATRSGERLDAYG